MLKCSGNETRDGVAIGAAIGVANGVVNGVVIGVVIGAVIGAAIGAAGVAVGLDADRNGAALCCRISVEPFLLSIMPWSIELALVSWSFLNVGVSPLAMLKLGKPGGGYVPGW